MMSYITMYYFFEKPLWRTVRLLLFLALLGLVAFALLTGMSVKPWLILLSLGIMAEVFMQVKLAHVYPIAPLSKTPSNLLDAATMPTIAAYHITDAKKRLAFILRQPDSKFMLYRMMISANEIQPKEVLDTDLLAKATQYAEATHTTYIDLPHLFGAYLVLSEPQTELLFSKELKEVDVMRIIVWTQLAYPKRQESTPHFQVIGDGYGEALVTGWTYETKKYTTDITSQALFEKPEMFGLNDVFTQMIGILSQPEHNNVLLIGEAGSGKDLLIEKMAFEAYNGHVPHNLQHKRVVQLMIGALLAGMGQIADLEQRLQILLAELAHADVIIAVPQLQDILGSSAFNIDLSGTLLPYLEHGTIPVIATTTPENYKKYVERSALKDVFTAITLPQPDTETLFGMLFMAVLNIEKKQNLHYSYLSLAKAAQLANRFDQIGVLPGAAVKLLEAVGTALLVQGTNTVTADTIASYVEQVTHVPVTDPDDEEKQLLSNLEQVLHEKVIGQDDAIGSISQGMRRLREGLASTTKPLSFLFLGPTGVGKTETAKALADIYYHGTANMLRFDMSEYSGPDGLRRLLGSAPGEGDEKGELTEKVFDHPSSLILLDEFEKANPTIHDLFLQVLDDGRLTDNKGKTVSFTNCIIIATSNAGSEFIREHVAQNQQVDKTFQQELLNTLQTNHIFKPELLNRFDQVVVFKPLDHSQVVTITTMLLSSLIKTLADQDITISFEAPVIEKIAADSFNAELGARPIQRHIQEILEDSIAKGKLNGTLVRGSKALFTLDPQGQIILQSL